MRVKPIAPIARTARVLWRLGVIVATGLLLALGVWELPWTVFAIVAGLGLALYGALFLRRGPASSLTDWLAWALDIALIAFFVRYTGAADSPLVVAAYVWLFGVIVVNLRGAPRAPVPVFALMAFVGLTLGMVASVGWVLGLSVHAIGLALMTLIAVELLKERSLGRIDPVTGVLHRRAGIDALGSWIARRRGFSLAFADLRGFKQVNDTYGHAVGDEVLKAVAQRIARAVRSNDIVMRYGGDEFVVASELPSVKTRIERTLEHPVAATAGTIKMDVDVGEVRWQHGTSLDALLSLADKAMYAEKRAAAGASGVADDSQREDPEPPDASENDDRPTGAPRDS